MQTVTSRPRKSVKLSPEELKALKAFRKTFELEVDCAEAIGISRETLGRVLLVGSGSPITISKIQSIIESAKA